MAVFLDGAVLGFFSRRFYYNLAYQYRGIGLGLVLLLALINVGLVVPWSSVSLIREGVDGIASAAHMLPVLAYRDQAFAIDKPEPYYVKLGAVAGSSGLLVDTHYTIGDTAALQTYMQSNHITVLLTANQLVTQSGGKLRQVDIRTLPLMANAHFTITQKDWSRLASINKHYGTSAVLAGGLAVFFIAVFVVNLAAVLVAAIFMKLLSLPMQADFGFSGAMRLAACAFIPVVLLASLPRLLGMAVLRGIYVLGIWLAYTLFAVFSSRRVNHSAA